MLIAALVRLAFDVQNDPAGLRIAIALFESLHGERIRLKQTRRILGERIEALASRNRAIRKFGGI